MVSNKEKIVSVSNGINDKILTYKVVKSNNLIQSKSDFSAVQHRIILFALVQIKPSDESLQPYKIEMSNILRGKGHYHLVRKAIQGLQNSTISIRQKGCWKSFPFIIHAREIRESKVYIELQFAIEIQRFLLDLRGSFTSYTLANVVNFNKNYSLRIYELCKQYESTGVRDITINFLRTMLSLEKKYKNYKDFRKWVLNPSIIEINEHSDIFVKVEEVFKGKKVDSLQFSLSKNKIKAPRFEVKRYQRKEGFDVNLETGFDKITTRRLWILQFTESDIDNFEGKYNNDKMIEALTILDSQIATIKNPKGFLVKALKQKWVANKPFVKPINKIEDLNTFLNSLIKRVN